MKIRWLLQACIVVAVGIGLVSCTKAEIEQAMNRPAEIVLQSSPCPPAEVSTATPEVCVILTEMRLISRDTQADVSLTLVNRTGRRLFLSLPSSPYLTDSNGSRWERHSVTGIGFRSPNNVPVPVEPNVETQVSILFTNKGRAPSEGTTFSMRGEIAIMKVDTRGQASPLDVVVTRGFNISGIRLPQQSPQSSTPTEQNQDTKLAQVPPQIVASATPKASASSQSTAPAAIAGASGIGNPSSQKPASSNASSTSGQMAKAIDTPAGDAETSKSGSKSVGSGGAGPDVFGLRIDMTPTEARTVFRSNGLVSNGPTQMYNEWVTTLKWYSATGASGDVPNGQYLNTLTEKDSKAGGSNYLNVIFAPIPRREGIVSIRRTVNFAQEKKPTFDAFQKALIAKYGTPTYSTAMSFFWGYDTNGNLQKPEKTGERITSCATLSNFVDRSPTWVLGLSGFKTSTGFELETFTAKCGAAVFLNVIANNLYTMGALVDGHVTSLIGIDAGIRAWKESKEIQDNAVAAANEAAIKKGQQQKPEL